MEPSAYKYMDPNEWKKITLGISKVPYGFHSIWVKSNIKMLSTLHGHTVFLVERNIQASFIISITSFNTRYQQRLTTICPNLHLFYLQRKWFLPQILIFSYPYIFATICRRPWIFQTIHSVRSNSVSLKYQSFIPLGWKDIGIRKIEFVATT